MRRILVVDDDQTARELYLRVLRNEGYDAAAADSGGAAVAMLLTDDNRPDAMFLDLQLGDTTGFDVLHEVRSRGLFVPTVVMTAFRLDFDPDRSIELGALGYVDQPLTIESLRTLAATLTRLPTELDEPNVLHSRVIAGDPVALECICSAFLHQLPQRLERAYPQTPWDFAVDAVSAASLEYAGGAARRYDPNRLPSVLDFVYMIARRNLLNARRSEASRHKRDLRFATEQAMAAAAAIDSDPQFEVWAAIDRVTKTEAERRAAKAWLMGAHSQVIATALGCSDGAEASRTVKQFKDRLLK